MKGASEFVNPGERNDKNDTGGFIKLERLKGKTKLNHFALKAKLYLSALHSAFSTLRTLTPVRGSA